MSAYYIASLKIIYFIAQNLGSKAKPRDHDPQGYFRSQKYPGYEVVCPFVYGLQNFHTTSPHHPHSLTSPLLQILSSKTELMLEKSTPFSKLIENCQ